MSSPRVVTHALDELFPEDPHQFLARTPHGYHDADQIRGELTAAGFSKVQFETVEHLSRCASPRDPAVAYCQGTPLRSEIAAHDPSGLERATEHAAEALSKRFWPRPDRRPDTGHRLYRRALTPRARMLPGA